MNKKQTLPQGLDHRRRPGTSLLETPARALCATFSSFTGHVSHVPVCVFKRSARSEGCERATCGGGLRSEIIKGARRTFRVHHTSPVSCESRGGHGPGPRSRPWGLGPTSPQRLEFGFLSWYPGKESNSFFLKKTGPVRKMNCSAKTNSSRHVSDPLTR